MDPFLKEQFIQKPNLHDLYFLLHNSTHNHTNIKYNKKKKTSEQFLSIHWKSMGSNTKALNPNNFQH